MNLQNTCHIEINKEISPGIACNYDSLATEGDESCLLPAGFTDSTACNYNATATCDDSSCLQADACGNCDGSGILNESGECIELYSVADFIRAQITGENNLQTPQSFKPLCHFYTSSMPIMKLRMLRTSCKVILMGMKGSWNSVCRLLWIVLT